MPEESKDTSLNQISAGLKVLKKMIMAEGKKEKHINLDYGGGRFDKGTNYLMQYGIHNMVYDPYNRHTDHNRAVLEYCMKYRVDSVTLLNVLNVIPDQSERFDIIEDIVQWTKPGAKVLISVYEKNGDGKTERTSKGYQNNQKVDFYIKEIMEEFDRELTLVNRKGNMFLLEVK